jgi:CBS domain-containing membrane protein
MHLLLGSVTSMPMLIAPMGASAVLLFAVPGSPLAQPWSIMGGNLVAATVGVGCAGAIADPVLAAALAVALAIVGMFALRCVHPPSGAVALTAVLGGPAIHALGYRFVVEPVALQSALLLSGALVYHAATGHRYPHAARPALPGRAGAATVPPASSFTRADLDAALRRHGELLDIAPDDVESLLRDLQLHALARQFHGLTCADIMSRPAVSVSPATSIAAAWRLLRRHRIKALPVTDAAGHVIGIVTRTDIVDRNHASGIGALPFLHRRGLQLIASTAPQVSSLMNNDVRTVDAAMPIVDLLPLFAHERHHHIPVVDADRRLAGMITQGNLIAGLYQQAYVQRSNAA